MKGGQAAKPKGLEECDCHIRFPMHQTYHYLKDGEVKSLSIETIKQMPTVRMRQGGGYEIRKQEGEPFYPLVKEKA